MGDVILSPQLVHQMKRQGQFNVPTLTVCREVVANPAVREYLQGTTKPNQTYSELIDNLKRLHVAYSRQCRRGLSWAWTRLKDSPVN